MAATAYVTTGSRNKVAQKISGTLRLGYGLPSLHVGMTREQCRKSFGDPDQVRSFKDGTFFQYLDAGFDLDFELGSKAERLFFYRAGVQKHRGQCEVTLNGIHFNSSAQEIEHVLGVPSSTGAVGKKRWILFDRGIQFDLDSRGRVEVIIVFRPHN